MSIRMRRGAAALAAVSVLGLTAAACGGSDGDKKSEKGQSDAKPLTAAQMKAGVITPADLPAGYKPMGDGESAGSGHKADKKECQPIAEFMNDKVSGATVGGDVDLQNANGDSLISQQVLTFSGSGAQDFMKEAATALGECTAFSVEQGGQKVEVKVEKISGPKAGEDSHNFRMKMKMASLSIEIETNLLVARQGTGITRIAHIPGDATGHKDFDDLAQRAGDKFAKAAQG
ncbi:hypothetical protein [Streptomyces albipurpureus]|uniref:Lipoprotein n=1 Tax=Streptomyces albipurpureus TaxID=2897419 RepID=A0ABT0UIQ3_9ACTN|nr:hypothetical protein [Streptomyces sp. CWNU-1]MCM2388512.1 hypothetical protein [Streptomyces sp. CWNU-1]